MGIGNFYAEKRPTTVGIRSKQLLNRRLLARILPTPSHQSCRLLEIGSGHGFFAKACLEAGLDYTGLEPDPVLLEQLHQSGYQVKEARCPPLPFESDQFDLVYAGWVLEYSDGPQEAYQFVRECYRVAKPGGLVAVVSSDYRRMRREFWDVGYNVCFVTTARRIRQIYDDVGLQHERTTYFAGNLFDGSRYLGYLFNWLYRYEWLENFSEERHTMDSRIWKLRFTFPEAVLLVGRR